MSDKSGAQVYVDALDIIAEDHGSGVAMKIVRALLRLTKSSKGSSCSASHPTLTGYSPLNFSLPGVSLLAKAQCKTAGKHVPTRAVHRIHR